MPERSSSRRALSGRALSGRARTLVIMAGAALILAGCASTSSKIATGAATSSSTPASSTTAESGGVVKTASSSLGMVVVDSASGHTLYHFDMDKTPGQSACTAVCATVWPPMIVTTVPTGNVGGGALGHITRADGTMQLTWRGMPLYRFANDTAPGDVKGDGFAGGIWHATRASAGAASGGGAPAPGATPTTAKSSGGYGY